MLLIALKVFDFD